jgi:hypothetical protein
MKRVRNRLIAKGLRSCRCAGDERKELEAKEIDEVKEVKEWRAAGRTGRVGGVVVDQSRLMLA